MPEIKREVRPVEVSYLCDGCGQGFMERCSERDPQSGETEHRCLICDHRQHFAGKGYPHVEYLDMDEPL